MVCTVSNQLTLHLFVYNIGSAKNQILTFVLQIVVITSQTLDCSDCSGNGDCVNGKTYIQIHTYARTQTHIHRFGPSHAYL